MISQQPYFKVNGVFTDYYPVPSTSLSDFNLPQDQAKGTFLTRDTLQFEIDESALPVPKEIVEKTKFLWDFGDGATAKGLKNTHNYSKPGTYFLSIKADSGEGFEPQLLQSTAINILPDKNYQLPKAVIKVNGKQSADPLTDIIGTDFKKEVSFDAAGSEPGSSTIVEYFWDLGDQASKTEKNFAYHYKENPYAVFPLLRVKTKDGFIADAFVQLSEKNIGSNELQGQTNSSNPLNWKVIISSAIFLLASATTIFWVFKKLLHPKRNNNTHRQD